MKFIVDAKQMQEIDRRTIEKIGIPAMVLMERAALSLAEQVMRLVSGEGKRKDEIKILAVSGTGGNGGDAIAAARILHLQGVSAEILLTFPEKARSKTAQQQLEIAIQCGVPVQKDSTQTNPAAYDVILDGIFGVGLSREITGEASALISWMNEAGTPILAVDIPSGIDAGSGKILGCCTRAKCTVTFGERKIGQLLYPGASLCGELVVADIGFPKFVTQSVLQEETEFCCQTYEALDLGRLPGRTPHSHKGTYGRVLVFAGSEEVTGAAYLAARAAYQCGVGLVKVMSVRKCTDIVRQMLPEALITELPELAVSADRQEKKKLRTAPEPEKRTELSELIQAEAAWADSIIAGPGIGCSSLSYQTLKLLIQEAGKQQKRLLLDADALNLLAAEIDAELVKAKEKMETDSWKIRQETKEETDSGQWETLRLRLQKLADRLPTQTVITPHPLELSRLTGLPTGRITGQLIDTAKHCTYNNEIIYVLKDARTIVAAGQELYLNTSGCDGMATGGSGDVLAGMIGGLMTGLLPAEAARLGVYLHGLAGEAAAGKKGCRGMLAGDLLEEFYY